MNIVYHSYRILFLAVSIKKIVDMSGNKQFVKTRACITRTAADLRQHIASALWRAYRQLRRRPAVALSCLRRSGAPYRTKAGKFPPSCAKFSTTTPSFLHVFGRAPGGL